MEKKQKKREDVAIHGAYAQKLRELSQRTGLMKTELVRRWIDEAYGKLMIEVNKTAEEWLTEVE